MPDGVFSFSPRVGSLSLLQGIFPTQGLNPGLPHCRQILYQLSTREAPLSPTTPYSKLLLHCPAQSLQTTLSSLVLHMAPWHWQEFGRSLFFFTPRGPGCTSAEAGQSWQGRQGWPRARTGSWVSANSGLKTAY